MQKLTSLLIFLAPVLACADCEHKMQSWSEALHPNMQLDMEHAICKANSEIANKIFAALPYIEKNTAPDTGDTYGLELVVANNEGKIIAHSYQSAAITSSAEEFDNLIFDKTPYNLYSKSETFAIRVNYTHSNPVNKYGTETLNMYIIEKNIIIPLFINVITNTYSKESDGTCNGNGSRITRKLSKGNANTAGYSNLIVREKRQDTEYRLFDQKCKVINASPKLAQWIINYDGSRYIVPTEILY